jgi:hypothetical protein
MTTAFQFGAFQFNAFQIGAPTPPLPPTILALDAAYGSADVTRSFPLTPSIASIAAKVAFFIDCGTWFPTGTKVNAIFSGPNGVTFTLPAVIGGLDLPMSVGTLAANTYGMAVVNGLLFSPAGLWRCQVQVGTFTSGSANFIVGTVH